MSTAPGHSPASLHDESVPVNAPLSAWITGVGLIAPGMPDWPGARAVLRGKAPWVSAPSVLPAPAMLPPAERRRASRVIKLALGIGLEAAAGTDVSTLATVFSASGADGHNCHALCEQLATDDRHISPTRFHNSVHNAPAGYWGIATKSMAPCQVLCAFDGSFGAGLIDALGQVVLDRQATLLLAYDSEYPEPLHATRPVPDCAGVALLLETGRTPQALTRPRGPRTWHRSNPCARPFPRCVRCRCWSALRKAVATRSASNSCPACSWPCGSNPHDHVDARPRRDRGPHSAPGQHVPARRGHRVVAFAHRLPRCRSHRSGASVAGRRSSGRVQRH